MINISKELLILDTDQHLIKKKLLLEVHLFNFSGNLYNKLLSVQFLKFIREEKKFKNVNQLQSQIKKDLNIAKRTK